MPCFDIYFHCACTETAIYKLPFKNVILPFHPANTIYYMTEIFSLSDNVCGIYKNEWRCPFLAESS